MTQEENLECSHQSNNSVHDQVKDDSTKSKNTDTTIEVNNLSSKSISEQIATDKLSTNIVIDSNGQPILLNGRSLSECGVIDVGVGSDGGSSNSNLNMTVVIAQNSGENIKEIQTKIENSNKIIDNDNVSVKDSNKIETEGEKPNTVLPQIKVDGDSKVTAVCDSHKVTERKSLSSETNDTGLRRSISPDPLEQNKKKDDDDPLARLDALRANISSVLKEVKAVLSQHGEPEQEKKEKEETKPTDNNVIRFRFVKRIKRRSTIDLEDENTEDVKVEKENKSNESVTFKAETSSEIQNKTNEIFTLQKSNYGNDNKDGSSPQQQQDKSGDLVEINKNDSRDLSSNTSTENNKCEEEEKLKISESPRGNEESDNKDVKVENRLTKKPLENKKSADASNDNENKQKIARVTNETKIRKDTESNLDVSVKDISSTIRRGSKEISNLEAVKLSEEFAREVNDKVSSISMKEVQQKSDSQNAIKSSVEKMSVGIPSISVLDEVLETTKQKSVQPETDVGRDKRGHQSRSPSPSPKIDSLQDNFSIMDVSTQLESKIEESNAVRGIKEGISDAPVTNTAHSMNASAIKKIEQSDLRIESIYESIETENRKENIDMMKVAVADASTSSKPSTKENNSKIKSSLKVSLRPRKPSFESIKSIISSPTEQKSESRRSSLPVSLLSNISKAKFIPESLSSNKKGEDLEVQQVKSRDLAENKSASSQNVEIDKNNNVESAKGVKDEQKDQCVRKSEASNKAATKESKSSLKIKLPIKIETNKVMALVKKPQFSLIPSAIKATQSVSLEESINKTSSKPPQMPAVEKTDQSKKDLQGKVEKKLEEKVEIESQQEKPEQNVAKVSKELGTVSNNVEGVSGKVTTSQISEEKVEGPTEATGNEEVEGKTCQDVSENVKENGSNDASTETLAVKKSKSKKKVVIRRIKRKLSLETSAAVAKPESTESELEICEKEIQPPPQSEPEKEEEKEELPPKRKSCLKLREYQLGDVVLYADRVKKVVKWKKATVVERVTSISYKLDVEGEEKSAHICYIKKYTGKRVQFGGKEYLEIDYAREESEEEEDEPKRPYSIWDRA